MSSGSQEGFGSRLGAALGTGLGEGFKVGVKDYKEQQKKLSQQLAKNRITPQDFARYANTFRDPTQRAEAVPYEDYQRYTEMVNSLIGQGYEPKQALEYVHNLSRQAGEDQPQQQASLDNQLFTGQPVSPASQANEREEDPLLKLLGLKSHQHPLAKLLGLNILDDDAILQSLGDTSFGRGFQSRGIGRLSSILNQQQPEEYERATSLDPNASFLDQLAYSGGQLAADSPLIALGAAGGSAAGTAVGGPLGTVAGGFAGAGALPELINTALKHYHEYQGRGYEGSFEDFINAVGETAQDTAQGGALGSIFGSLKSGMPALKKVPALKKLFETKGVGKAAQILTEAGTGATALSATQALAKGELPSAQDWSKDFLMFLGFDLIEGAGKYKKSVTNLLNKSKIPPQEAAQRIQKVAGEKGYDLSKPKDVVRAVKDITKEASPTKELAKGALEDIGARERFEPRKKAEQVASRPLLPEFLEEDIKAQERRSKPLTEKEQLKRRVAGEKAKSLTPQIEKLQSEIKYVEERVPKAGLNEKQQSQLNEYLAERRSRLSELTKEKENLEGISEKGRVPFREEDISTKTHMEDLEEFAKNPKSEKGEKIEAQFQKDQKYVQDFAKILESGQLPEGPYKDHYIKTLDVYNKAYDKALSEVKSSLKDLKDSYAEMKPRTKGRGPLAKKIQELSKHLKALERNIEVNRSKVGRQKDKIRALYELKRPGSALTKQIAKQMRRDIPQLQKDFVKAIEKTHEITSGVEPVTQKKFAEISKQAGEYFSNPTEESAKKLAQETNTSPKEIKETHRQAKEVFDEVSGLIDDLEKSKTQKADDSKLKSHLNKIIKRLKSPKKVLLDLGIAMAVNAIADKYKINKSAIYPLLAIGGVAPVAVRGLGSFLYKLGKDKFKESKREAFLSEYKKAKSQRQKQEVINQARRKGMPNSEIRKALAA